jgi:hypothetical protein
MRSNMARRSGSQLRPALRGRAELVGSKSLEMANHADNLDERADIVRQLAQLTCYSRGR